MSNKFNKLMMLLTLFSIALSLGLSSSASKPLSSPTKTAVSYADEDTTINNHDTNHLDDYGWISFSSSGYETGSISGGISESAMSYYYLENDVSLSYTLSISNYITICLNGYTLEGIGTSQ